MKTITIKAVVATTLLGSLLAGPAFAGADEAHMWSFMTGSPSTTAAAPPSNSGDARAEYQGDGFTVLRHGSHRYLDCMPRGGGRLTCKSM